MTDAGSPITQAEIDQLVDGHLDELIAFRRHLHSYPELSYEEHETTALITRRLEVAGLEPAVLPVGTGSMCDVGSPGARCVALRADIDALAMDDETSTPYRSTKPGVAHACGHDVHTTMVLGAGLVAAELAPRLPGQVRLIFEPAEETLPGGAMDVIAAGGVEGVDAIFGLHCDPKLDVGHVALRAGAITSAADMFTIRLEGPGGHTARPQRTVDLVRLAGTIATTLPAEVSRATDGAGLVVFGALHTGDASNVIPSHAELRGTFRSPERDVWDGAEDLLRSVLDELVGGTGATWMLDHSRGIPPVVNDPDETRRLRDVARRVLGADHVTEAQHSLGGDSFAWYLAKVPGSYARLGVHDPRLGEDRLDLHSSHFDADERAIRVGVRLLVAAAVDRLLQPEDAC